MGPQAPLHAPREALHPARDQVHHGQDAGGGGALTGRTHWPVMQLGALAGLLAGVRAQSPWQL